MLPDPPEDNPIQRQIDENLKRIFDETASEPLPDELTDLLARLRDQETRK
ncbi:MAG: hypothetical protein KDA73_13640 [Rhodobacteraceae bacterium]|nr:hypothetical protein [Paracoccaceae bacterium]